MNCRHTDRLSVGRTLGALGLVLAMLTAPGRAGENWAQWRGPEFNGSTDETNLPATWSKADGVAWTRRMPGPSASTPIIWGDRVFASSTNASSGDLLAMCLDARTGKVLWSHKTGKRRTLRSGKHNASSPSAVTDGRSVYFLYGTGDFVAFDVKGTRLWSRQLEADYGRFIIKWGYGSSPLLYDGRLYVVVLQNRKPGRYDVENKNGLADNRKGPVESFLLAIDPKTGKTLWRHVRLSDADDEGDESYATPMPFAPGGRKQIILHGGEYVTGHDAATGKELWRWEFSPVNREVWQRTVSSSATDGSRIFVGRARWRGLYCLKPAGAGRMTDAIVKWKHEKHSTDACGPLIYRGRVYLLSGAKRTLACLDLKTGRLIWVEKLKSTGEFRCSPTGAAGKIYFMSMSGEVFVVQAGDTVKQLAKIDLKERTCYSSISAAGGRLFIRTPRYVTCVGPAGK